MSAFRAPEWASEVPLVKNAVLEVYKDGVLMERIRIGMKAYVTIGRNSDICDVAVNHASISRMHAAFVHDKCQNIQIMDLDSSHGTMVDGKKMESGMPIIIADGQVIKFGHSSRDYRVKMEESAAKPVIPESSTNEWDNDNNTKETDPNQSHAAKRVKLQSIRCRHILVKHAGSRRPSSWKSPKITRTLDEAVEIIKNLKIQVDANPQSFADVATTESDCSSHNKGGDLGVFEKGKMQKEFENAAFALNVGQIVGPVFTESGVHLIMRIEE